MGDRTAPVSTDTEVIERYLSDESSYSGHASGVVLASELDDVVRCFQSATAARQPVTISARRTSLTGAAVPEGGWVLALEEVSSPGAVRVDRERRLATAPAQTLVADLEEAASAADLFFPVDPTSRKSCSIGGAVACNASGARSFAHGPVGAWIEGLVVVLASGAVVTLRRGEHPATNGAFHLAGHHIPCPPPRPEGVKSALGYAVFEPPDAIDLFVGSEGTLGYVHEVTVRLLERRPVFAALVFWDQQRACLDFVARLQADRPDGLEPMSVEYFDRRALELASAAHPRFGVPPGAVAALFVEQRHAPGEEEAVAMAWYEALLEAGAPDDEAALRIPRTRADLEAFRDFRHAVPEAINALARRRGLRKLGTDLAYPAGWLHRMVDRYTEEIARSGLDAAVFGHIGDNHLHVNLLPRDEAEAEAGRQLYAELAAHCAEAGGSISGEHGIGKSKRALLASVLPPATLRAMKAVKDALDPQGLLGRGNVFE